MTDVGLRDGVLAGAADDLAAHLARLGPDVHIARRLIAGATMTFEGD